MTEKRLRQELEKRFPGQKVIFEEKVVRVGQASMSYFRANEIAKDTNSIYKTF